MKNKSKYRLLWIRALMVVSQLLLIGLICSWLYTQYGTEKDELEKELNTTLGEVQKQISDSLLFAQFISPVLDAAKSSGDVSISWNVPDSGVFRNKMVLKVGDSQEKRSDSILQHDMLILRGFEKDSLTINGKRVVSRTVYRSSNEIVAEKIAMPIVASVLERMTERGILKDQVTLPSYMMLDTLQLKNLFARRLHQNGQFFTTVWLSRRYDYDEDSKDILIKTEYYGRHYYAIVKDYSDYIVRSMAPQIAFTLFLLVITSLAFALTLRTIGEQMRLSRIKNEFISNMSHELKTPISTVKVALEALQNFNMLENPVVSKEYLQMASQEMNRLDMLVNQSLNAALLEEGKITVRKDNEDLERIMSDTLAILKIRLQKYNASVATDTTGSNFTISADRLHIQGVLVNLVDNSLKYSKGNPEIFVDLKETDKHIVLSVSDNGPGIPKEYLSKIYDKFFRVPTGDTHNVKGYGLGLNYAKQIMEQHNGQIAVHNRAEGGCTFTLTFPKAS